MTVPLFLLASITIAILIIGSTENGHDIAREVEAPRSKTSTLDLGIAEEAEKKLHDLNFRFEQLQRTNDEQKSALELAEKELKRAKLEASSTFKERTMNLAATFWKQRAKPSIIALRDKTTGRLVHVKEWSEPHIGSAKTKWVLAAKQQFGIFMINMRPYMKELSTKTIKVYEVSKSTMKPHFDKVQEMDLSYYKKWVPAAKQQFGIFMINMGPYMKELSTKTIKVYEVSKSTMKPHFDKVQEMDLSYYKKWVPPAKQQFENFMINMEPYMKELPTQVVEVYEMSKSTKKPHFDKVQKWTPAAKQRQFEIFMTNMEPCMRKLSTKTIEDFAVCNDTMKPHFVKVQQVALSYYKAKSNINEDLMKHDLTRGYATTELASVMAYVLLAFPVFFLYRFLRSIFSTKKWRQLKRTSHESEPQRQTKRSRRADN